MHAVAPEPADISEKRLLRVVLTIHSGKCYSHECSAIMAMKIRRTAVMIIIARNFLLGNTIMKVDLRCKYPGKIN